MSTRSPSNADALRIGRRAILHGIAATAGAASLASILGACSGGDPGGSTSPGGAAGGKLTIGWGSELADFDPYNHLLVNFPAMNTLYSYLIDLDDDYQPSPDLAQEWTIAEDNSAVDIVLREATFHDGSPVTAADIVAGIERGQSDTGLNQTQSTAFIASATDVDEHTVHVEFTSPISESLILDFMYWFPVIRASGNDPEQLKQTPAGSGPFVLKSYSPGTNLVLTKNPDYYDSSLPYLDELEFRFFDSADALVSGLEAGSVDGVLGLDSRYVEQVSANYSVIEGSPGALINIFYMNPMVAPFDNKLVRQALARAIDRDRLVEQVQFNVGDPVYSIFPPNSPAFDANLLDAQGFDLDAARSLLQESGVDDLSATAYIASSNQSNLSALQIMQEDFAEIGFTLSIEPMDNAAASEMFRGGEGQCTIRGASNSYGSPTGASFSTPFRTENNPLWPDGVPQAWSDAVEKSRTALTEEDVANSIDEMNRVLVDEAWGVGLYTQSRLQVFDKSVTGFTRTPADHPVFTETKVNP